MIWLYKSVRGHGMSVRRTTFIVPLGPMEMKRILQISLRCDSLLVHAAAQSLDIITDVSDHAVPLVSL